MSRSTRAELPHEVALALHFEIQELLSRDGVTQTKLAKRFGCTQPAINKLADRPEVGRELGEKILKSLGYGSFDALVQKQKTRAWANDIAHYLKKFPDLAEALQIGESRWSLTTLSDLVVRLKRGDRNLSTSDGNPVRGSWEDVLNEIEQGEEPNVVGGIDRFRLQKSESLKKL